MNYWTELSIEFANQRNYLDELFKVYPTIPEAIREMDSDKFSKVEDAFKRKDNTALIKSLLALPLFPIKDSYVAYLKRDSASIERNPETVARLCGRVYEMGLNEIFRCSSIPKEMNRQIGPLFKRWLHKGTLGLALLDAKEFAQSKKNALFNGSDAEMMAYAKEHLGYRGDKGLDFLARMRNTYVIGEAKFLTDLGGHQNAQFEDAKALLKNKKTNAIKVAILDGVLYIKGRNKMYNYLTTHAQKYNILSSLLLREFLYAIK